jgi:ubiquinone/menaquinone biosynthesis C-methylase UbiE
LIRTADSLLLRKLFLEHGFEYHIAAKQYATHHLVQDWQFRFLYSKGLKPHHYLLDIGCGWLRLAQAVLPYLEDGRYFGIDAVQVHLDMGVKFLQQTGVAEQPTLLCDTDFAFDTFGVQFDVAISHAVFTHLTHEQIRLCLTQLKKVMRPGGRCYCTFYQARRDAERRTSYKLMGAEPLEFGSAQVSVKYFAELFRKLDLSWEYLGRCNHPTGQDVIEITFQPLRPGLRPGLIGAARKTARKARRGLKRVLGE